MEGPLIAQTTAEAIQYTLTWLGAALAFIALVRIIRGVAQYYVAAGDAEIMHKSVSYIYKSVLLLILSIILSSVAFFIFKNY